MTDLNEAHALYDALLLDEIRKSPSNRYISRPEGFGITIQEFAEQEGKNQRAASYILDQEVKAKRLEKHSMCANGGSGRLNVYHRPGDWPPKCEKQAMSLVQK